MSSQTTQRQENARTSAAGVIDQPGKGDETILDDDRETLLRLFQQMLLIRRFEEKCAESYSMGKIGGFCHLYIGQEAVSTGSLSLLRPDDYVITTYRDHGQAIARDKW
jgi:pyruvate dehydrogenase E1 component alpha subunit